MSALDSFEKRPSDSGRLVGQPEVIQKRALRKLGTATLRPRQSQLGAVLEKFCLDFRSCTQMLHEIALKTFRFIADSLLECKSINPHKNLRMSALRSSYHCDTRGSETRSGSPEASRQAS